MVWVWDWIMARTWSWTDVTVGWSRPWWDGGAERKEESAGGKWSVLVRLKAVEQPGWTGARAVWYGVGWKATVGETAVPAVPSISLMLSTWAGRAEGGE